MRTDLSEDDREGLMEMCSKITFAIYCIGASDARYRVPEYVRLAADITKKKISVYQIKFGLRNIIYVGKDRAIDRIKKGLETFADDDWYPRRTSGIRYLLYKYEEYLMKEKGYKIEDNNNWKEIWSKRPAKTIEHILPQSTDKDYIHRIGNLFLLPPGVNSKIRDKDPKYKKEYYEITSFLMARDIIKVLEKWNRKSVDERGKKIAEWARKEWGTLGYGGGGHAGDTGVKRGVLPK